MILYHLTERTLNKYSIFFVWRLVIENEKRGFIDNKRLMTLQ